MAKRLTKRTPKVKTRVVRTAAGKENKSRTRKAPAKPRAIPKRRRDNGEDASHVARGAKTRVKSTGRRADLGAPVETALGRMPEPQQSMARALDAQIRREFKHVESRVSWGNAMYCINGTDLMWIWVGKNYISLAFGNGVFIRDPNKLLEGTGKQMRHTKVRSMARAESDDIADLIRECVAQARAGNPGVCG